MSQRLLQRLREPALASAAFAVVAGAAALLPSGSRGFAHTPLALLYQGLVDGLVASLLAVGIVLVYRSLRIVNFAQLALPSAGAILAFDLVELTGFPPLLGIALGVAFGAAMGGIMHLVFGIRFARAPRLVLTIATVFVGSFLSQQAKGIIDLLPFLPPVAQRSSLQNQGGVPMRQFLPLANWHYTVGSFPFPFGFAELFAIGVSIATILALVGFLRFTRWGRAMRAIAENAERASLLGISVGMISLLTWLVSGALGGIADILTGTVYVPAKVYASVPEDLLIPLTAAILARMRSFWTATLMTVAITMFQRALAFQQPGSGSLFDTGLFVVVTAGLLLSRRGLGRTGVEATSWQGTQEVRPIPREMARLPMILALRWGSVVALVAVLVALPFFTSISNLETVTSMALLGIVVISLVVLTGWAGQASFGQFAFAAVGSLVAGYLAAHLGLTFWLAVPLATVLCAGFAVAMGFPALRTTGIFLVVVTYALAVAAHSLLFDPRYFGWLDPGVVHRPSLFVISFEDETWMYGLGLVALLVTIFVVRNLRRSRFGRAVIAARENEADLQAGGIPSLRIKLSAFAAAGAIAGFAGALLAFQQHGSNQTVFTPDQSLVAFQMLIIGGASSVGGALLGTVVIFGAVQLSQLVPGSGIFLSALPLVILWATPGGLLAALTSARDAALRIIAQRSQMVVPSLYGDVEPEALRLRLIPLAQSAGGVAFNAYRLAESRLRWVGLHAEGAAGRNREAAALTAAIAGAEPEAEAVSE